MIDERIMRGLKRSTLPTEWGFVGDSGAQYDACTVGRGLCYEVFRARPIPMSYMFLY